MSVHHIPAAVLRAHEQEVAEWEEGQKRLTELRPIIEAEIEKHEEAGDLHAADIWEKALTRCVDLLAEPRPRL